MFRENSEENVSGHERGSEVIMSKHFYSSVDFSSGEIPCEHGSLYDKSVLFLDAGAVLV